MKSYSNRTLLFLSFVFLFSCKKDKLETYNGARVIYFYTPIAIGETNARDSIAVDFAFLPDEVKDTVLNIQLRLLGPQLAVASPYEIGVTEQVTTAVNGLDYKLPSQFSFRAGKSTDSFQVQVFRPEKPDSQNVLGLELKSNQQFNNRLLDSSLDKTQNRKIRIHISNVLSVPIGWESSGNEPGGEYYLGRFTRKKVQVISKVIIDVTGNPDWNEKNIYDNIIAYRITFGSYLSKYLSRQKAAGTPVLEDDGSLMEAGIYFK